MRMIQQLKSQKRGLGGKRKAKVSFYELITVMSVMAYGNFYNKIRFLYAVYDFDCNKSIDEDEDKGVLCVVVRVEMYVRY